MVELRRLLYNAVLLAVGVAAIAGMEWLMGQSFRWAKTP